MTFDALRNLQVEDVMRWSIRRKILGGLLLVLLTIGINVYWFIRPEQSHAAALQHTITTLKSQISEKDRIAALLPKYQRQIVQMKKRFHHFLRQLPDRAEIPALLDQVTLDGRADGLKFQLFQPLPTRTRPYYVEIPVRIRVTGHYADIGRFAASLSTLPRIVNLDHIQITKLAPGHDHSRLTLNGMVTTYRYAHHTQTPPATPKSS